MLPSFYETRSSFAWLENYPSTLRQSQWILLFLYILGSQIFQQQNWSANEATEGGTNPRRKCYPQEVEARTTLVTLENGLGQCKLRWFGGKNISGWQTHSMSLGTKPGLGTSTHLLHKRVHLASNGMWIINIKNYTLTTDLIKIKKDDLKLTKRETKLKKQRKKTHTSQWKYDKWEAKSMKKPS